MKAIVYHSYGSADVLRCEEIEKPAPGENDVLIKVRAASVNPLDWRFMRGTPYIGRLMFGLRKPKITRLGADVAGQVEAVGGKVSQFQPGDQVFGGCRGAFAEYACTAESALVKKPDSVTFEQAAALPVAGLTALQALRDKARTGPGQKVLINGAAGGVGTFAVQIAKVFGAEVTGVCSTRNVELVRSLGADHVIDYTQAEFTKGGQRYDVLLDMVANHPLRECRRILRPQGIYLLVGGPEGRWAGPLARLLQTLVLSPFVKQKMMLVIAKRKKEDLAFLAELIESGKIRPVIDRRYKLNEAAEAVRYVEEGHARGKVIITVQ